MKKLARNNYAFIDSQNLNKSIAALGWKLNFKRFRVYLRDKYSVVKAYLFIGFLPENEQLYRFLQNAGYICIFKPTIELGGRKVKGNVDAELVLHSMIQFQNYDQAVIVSGDGDFFCLAEYLLGEGKLLKMLIPNERSYSGLLKRLNSPKRDIFEFISALRNKLQYLKEGSEKGPQQDGT
jgi:uncharacterized LabA/DUF88 family protein